MNVILERTLHKLLDGSKKFYLNACKNEEYQGSDVNSIRSSENCKKFMQKRVTNYFAVNGKLNEINVRIIF